MLSNSTKRLFTGTIVFVFIVGILMVPATFGQEEDGSYLIGHDSLYMGDEWMKVTDKAIHLYALEQGWNVITQNAHFKVADQVKQLRYFQEKGVDGVIWSPVAEEATADVVEYLAEQGVPTVTYNTDVKSDAVPITVMFGNKEAAKIVAREAVDYLKEKQGEPEGVVLSIQGDPANTTDRNRAEGFKEVFTQYEGIEFVEFFTESDMAEAQRKAYNAIQQHGRPVAIVSQNTTNARGGTNALKQADMLVPRGEEDHVFISSIGGAPAYLDMMEEGFVDRGYVQPNLFYGPLAMHYLVQVIEEGEESLPEVGTTVTADDVQITGGTYEGVSPWEEQIWAPAEVTTNFGHKWLKVQGMLVTPDNMDDPRIWGNTAEEWLN